MDKVFNFNQLKLEKTSETIASHQFDCGELIVRYLEQIGVEYVFGVPGGAIEPLYNALARSERNGGIRAVLACHETGAAYMAEGYARETGKLGVCIATSGPGATNLITGVANAYANHIPILVLTGQAPLPNLGKGALQESSCTGVNIVAMYEHCTHYNSFISHPDQLENKLINAVVNTMHSPKGPSHLSIPVDILRHQLSESEIKYDLLKLTKLSKKSVNTESVQDLAETLSVSSNKVFYIGNVASECVDLIIKLVEITDALFITSPNAKGLINTKHQAYRGVFGFGGHKSAEKSLNNADLIIAIGTNFSELSSNGWSDLLLNKKLIHIDNEQDNLLRSPIAHSHYYADLAIICAELLIWLINTLPKKQLSTEEKEKTYPINPFVEYDGTEKYFSNSTPIKPQRLMKELSERLPSTTKFLADSGNSMVWAAHFLDPPNRRSPKIYEKTKHKKPYENRRSGGSSLQIALDFAPMGWAIGTSIGIARGNPKIPVVCITGDGSYLMSGQEIAVAAQEKLTVIFVILNDSGYGMVKHGQSLAGAENTANQLRKVNFKKLVASMGIPGHIIKGPKDFKKINFNELITRKGPTLLDVRIDPEEVPPMVMRVKTLGSLSNG